MGEALGKRMNELLPQIPLGIDLGLVSLQSEAVTEAISGFVISLIQAVVIVIAVLLVFMGLRSGLLIGFVLVLTISGTFIFMGPWGVALERISLGALIIALGMLVDNAIVVVDGMLIRIQRGEDPKAAAAAVVNQTAMPLLGATIVAILAFAAIGTSDDSTGEFCRSLFQVVFISLGLSWITAVTVTPLLGVMFLKPPSESTENSDPYGSRFYRSYQAFLRGCIRARWVTVAAVIGVFFTSLWGFGFVDQSFFPPSTRPQFMIDLWMPMGTHIDDTTHAVEKAEEYLHQQEGVEHVNSLVGQGALRFILTYTARKAGQLLRAIDRRRRRLDEIPALTDQIARDFEELLPDALAYGFPFELGPGANGKIRARFSGPDPAILRELADEAMAIFHADPNAKAIRTDWRQRVKVVEPVLAEKQANANGITRTDVANTMLQAFQGASVGVYREGDLLLPIILRAPELQRTDVASMQNLQIWSPVAQGMIPLRQVVSGFETRFEDEIIMRRDRKPTITVFGDPKTGPASVLFNRLRPQIEAMELPPDYFLEWGGEYEDTAKARGPAHGEPADLRADDGVDHDRALQHAQGATDHLALRSARADRRDRGPVDHPAAVRFHGAARILEPDGDADQERGRADRRNPPSARRDRQPAHRDLEFGNEPLAARGDGRFDHGARHDPAVAGRVLRRDGGDDHLRLDVRDPAHDDHRARALRDLLRRVERSESRKRIRDELSGSCRDIDERSWNDDGGAAGVTDGGAGFRCPAVHRFTAAGGVLPACWSGAPLPCRSKRPDGSRQSFAL